MTLPAPRKTVATPPVTPLPPHVLIVDDHQGVTRALAAVLQRSGFQPTCFNNGRDVVNFINDGGITNPVAAVVLDIHMPDMSGLVVSQKLRSRLGPAVPIVILSGDTSMETLNSLPHVGATHFFSKPIKAEQLVTQLRELLAMPSAA